MVGYVTHTELRLCTLGPLVNRSALAALLSCAFLLAACTPADAPPPPAADGPVDAPTPGVETPTPVPGPGPVVVDAPPQAGLSWVRANSCDDGAPMSLTASDGSGLRLASLKARAVVEGPLAFTELTLSFDNPVDRQLEGRFAITLPPGAAISRFAMKIDDRWQEGEVVERQAARVAYEDFLHRRQDPALLEQDAGNVFRARVFPIAAKARKEIILSYSQELPHSAEPYRLPICGLPQLDELDVDVAIVKGAVEIDSSLEGQGSSVYHLSMQRQAFAPRQDLEARVGDENAEGVRHGDLAVVRIKPVLDAPEQSIEELTILFDTSASRALDFRGQVDRLGALVAALPAATKVHLFAYDQETVPIFEGRADALGKAQLDQLALRGALGASDLAQALEVAAEQGGLYARVLLVGDGVVTAGETEAATLQTQLRAMAKHGVQRVDALVDGGIQDTALLTAMTQAGLPDDGAVLDARMPTEVLAKRLGQATRSKIKVSVPGAQWVWPQTLDAVQPGDERLVYAKLPVGTPMQVELAGASVAEPKPSLAIVPRPMLARAHARAQVAALEQQRSLLPADDKDGRARLKDEIVALSVNNRVLSGFTALLVLETAADYARFGIDRKGLVDILTVGAGGIELHKREPFAPEPEPKPILIPESADVDGKKDAEKGRTQKLAFAADDDALAGDFEGGDEGQGQREDNGEDWHAREPEAEPEMDLPSDPSGLALRGTGAGGGGTAEEDAAVDEEEPMAAPRRRRPRPERRPPPGTMAPPVETKEKAPSTDPYEGRLATVMAALAGGKLADATTEANAWRADSPGDVLALIALGEVAEARGDTHAAARAYGSLIDLFPSRADIRRMAGERLERVGGHALPLAIDTYAHAVEQRGDHPSSHRLYAYALLRAGKHAEAFAALEAALDRSYPGGRFAGVVQVLREDLGLVGAAWIAADPSVKKRVTESLTKRSASLPTTPSTRFVLNWETDANDVDLHVYDARGGHAYYSSRHLGSGGDLYADVTTGYGPECFAIHGKPKAGPYKILAHYYSRGPMGYGMGKVQVVEHDGRGGLTFSEHPFVIQKDDGYADVATFRP